MSDPPPDAPPADSADPADPSQTVESYEIYLPGVRPQQAFDGWVGGIGHWWGAAAPGDDGGTGLAFDEREPGGIVGLRVGGQTVPWGRVTRWEPGRAVTHTILAPEGVAPAEVAVEFLPEGDGTLVRLGGDAVTELAAADVHGGDHAWAIVLARYAAYVLDGDGEGAVGTGLARLVAGVRQLGPTGSLGTLGALGDLGVYGSQAPLVLIEAITTMLRRRAAQLRHVTGVEDADQLDVLVAYVPITATNAVLDAVFTAGAGVLGDYRECAFVCRGMGQFRPIGDARPVIGRLGARERVPEDRIEVTVRRRLIGPVVAALRAAHPYEEPAFHVVRTARVDIDR